jgi:undecaprenyl-diphosphatase
LWVAFAALAVAVGFAALPGDGALFQLAGENENAVLRTASRLASAPVWSAVVLLAAGLLWWHGRRWLASWLVATEVTAEIAALALKALVNRPRPVGAVLEDVVATASFPSSHAVRASATLGVLLVALVWREPPWRSWRVPALLVALLYLLVLGAARVASGEHWPSDVLGGYLLGAAWAATVTALPWYKMRVELDEQ